MRTTTTLSLNVNRRMLPRFGRSASGRKAPRPGDSRYGDPWPLRSMISATTRNPILPR